ncbi:DoxX family protein [Alkalilimnicola ehrlichii]|uniref:DoxX family protein n=1 Tax=Alkalilimnicola ehrlichii TaxID=351052 RepID=UPI003B9EC85A
MDTSYCLDNLINPVSKIFHGRPTFTNGWVTRLGALATVPVLLGAIFMAHWGQWHFLPTATHPMGGMMFQVSLLFVALYLLAKGNDA